MSLLEKIGASLNKVVSKNGSLVQGYEDFSNALFLRYIFHFFYGLDYSQILVTSTKAKGINTKIASLRGFSSLP